MAQTVVDLGALAYTVGTHAARRSAYHTRRRSGAYVEHSALLGEGLAP